MKHSFLVNLTALLLGAIMAFSLIPAIAIGTKAADSPTEFDLVTDHTTLKEGDRVIIVGYNDSTKEYFALGTTQNTNSRAAVAINVTDGKTVIGSDIQVMTLKVGTKSGTFAFDTGSGYLYAASSGSNHLKTETELSGNSSWAISIDVEDKATIKANGENTRNWLLYNITGRFSAYADTSPSVKDTVYIYKAASNCAHANTEAIGTPSDATCTEPGITAGEKCSDCGEIITKQETVPMVPHNFVNNVCSVCGAEKPTIPTYEKVTSTTLDDYTGTYLIVYEAGKLAFNGSLDKTTNKMDVANNGIDLGQNLNTVDGIITGEYGAYTFTITKNDDEKYTIYSASGFYIGKTANSNGLDINVSNQYTHTISIDDSGNALITSSGNPILLFNAASDQMRFRYYKSNNQEPIALYKLVEETPEPEEPEVEAPVFSGFGLTLNQGVTVRVKFNITQAWIDANTDAKVTFNNGTVCDLLVGENYYTTTLTPGQIGDALTVTLGDITKDVSVSAYIEKAKEVYASDTKLCALLDAIDVYGKAAAKVEQTLTAPDFNAIADPVVTDKSVITKFTDATLDKYATIGLAINAEDGYTFVASRGTVTTGKLVLADHLKNGVLSIDNICPANFGDVITVTIYDGDTEVASTNFTFNSYLKLAYGKAANDLERNIVIAAYNYGVAAAAYVFL